MTEDPLNERFGEDWARLISGSYSIAKVAGSSNCIDAYTSSLNVGRIFPGSTIEDTDDLLGLVESLLLYMAATCPPTAFRSTPITSSNSHLTTKLRTIPIN